MKIKYKEEYNDIQRNKQRHEVSKWFKELSRYKHLPFHEKKIENHEDIYKKFWFKGVNNYVKYRSNIQDFWFNTVSKVWTPSIPCKEDSKPSKDLQIFTNISDSKEFPGMKIFLFMKCTKK